MAAALVCAGAGVGAAAAEQPAVPPGPTPTAATGAPRIESALLTEMNRVRTQRGRVALRTLPSLTRAARGHSGTLLTAGVFQHDSLDGAPFWTRLVAAGFPAARAGWARTWRWSRAATARPPARPCRCGWRSPGHRANLLNPRFRFVGSGAAIDGDCSLTFLTADYGSEGRGSPGAHARRVSPIRPGRTCRSRRRRRRSGC